MPTQWFSLAADYADAHGNESVTRWRDGLSSADAAGLAELVDFPPGPMDRYNDETPIIAKLVGMGWVDPLPEFLEGQRIYKTNATGLAGLTEMSEKA